jgi:hypothetical protein
MSLIASEGGSANEVNLRRDANKGLKSDEASSQNGSVATTHAPFTSGHTCDVEQSMIGTETDVQLQLNISDCSSEFSSDSMPEFESCDTDSLSCYEQNISDSEIMISLHNELLA